MERTMEAERPPAQLWSGLVMAAVKNLKFGVVQIVVHDGKVVQIETTEKVRFTQGE